ncbi:MAG: DUF2953 domain-containing protein [Ruminococcus sp.]|nr:DUF2953 domain-containing protein [Candidatus Apopatosoma intestinale]
MTWLWILLGILGFFAFLLFLPATLQIRARLGGENDNGANKADRKNGVFLFLRVLFVKIKLYPGKPRVSVRSQKKKEKKTAKKAQKKAQKQADGAQKEKPGVVELIRLVIGLTKKLTELLARHLRITLKRYRVVVSTDDAAKTALLYGGVSQATSYLFLFLEEEADFHIPEKSDVDVRADFTAGHTTAEIALDFRLFVWQLFSILLGVAMEFVRRKAENKATE